MKVGDEILFTLDGREVRAFALRLPEDRLQQCMKEIGYGNDAYRDVWYDRSGGPLASGSAPSWRMPDDAGKLASLREAPPETENGAAQ
jgi:hypothetical protein